ncbi:DUF2892 domain-containing protein [Bacillus sp. SB49]|uniref:YgaP family membrane protein n=1 Tax=Bacillaceae TaxID=186817 RepID=UPI00040A8F49|nr:MULTISPECIES: DUF2892 domain-containing protein [Bacillaceae]QHT45554.1 DUF2892 domain-containing protein [Bacillus sp. SB49]
MRQNIGTINSMIRIATGLSMLTLLTIRGSRGHGSSHPFLIALASMKVAEGIVRYCPMVEAIEKMTVETDGKEEGWQQNFPK